MNYITMDIETTGLDIFEDEPIQMAYTVHDDKDVLLHENSFYIRVERSLPSIITKITGTTDEILKAEGIPPSGGMLFWKDVVKKYQPVSLVGYNIINFDFPMVQNWINKYSHEKFKFPPICCIHDVMITLASWRRSKWLKLAEAGRVCGIEFKAEDLHDAMADVKLTWEIYKTLRRKGGN